MANHKSAKKRIRQTERRAAVNRTRVSGIRKLLRQVETAIGSSDKKAAAEALKAVQPALMKGVNAGVLKLNAASRKMGRLSARVKALA